MGEMLDAALAYAARGWHVFPCLPPDAAACRDMEPHKRGKTPACAHGKDDATTDSDTIKTWWWWENPNYNIGVRTGKESGFFVIDVDGGEGESELRKLEDQFGQLPPTLESITGRGGRHLCFQIDSHPIRNSASTFAPKVDVRANGGYIVAPPSLHGLGRRYAGVSMALTTRRLRRHGLSSAPSTPGLPPSLPPAAARRIIWRGRQMRGRRPSPGQSPRALATPPWRPSPATYFGGMAALA
jgi:hypothetical protein